VKAAPGTPLSQAEAKAALTRETKAIEKLQNDVERNGWQIGKRLVQVVTLDLFKAGGHASIEDYAEQTLGIGRTTAFQYMRIAQAFSEDVAAAFGLEKLDRGLAYIAKTPEDEKPGDIPHLKMRVPDEAGKVHERAFENVTLRDLKAAVQHEAEAAGKKKKRKEDPSLAPHTKAAALANRALDKAVGAANAAKADLTLRSAGGVVLVDVCGVPLGHAAKALAAVAKAFA